MLAVSQTEVAGAAEESLPHSQTSTPLRPAVREASPSFTPPVFGFRRHLASLVLQGSILDDRRSARDIDQCLLDAMERLALTNLRLARAFDLYFFAGCGYQAIAASLDVTMEESEKLVSAAREAVARELLASRES